MRPYHEADGVTLYLGDCREVLPTLGLQADLVCTDPPYGETSLAWDRWPDGWPTLAATVAPSMWCFGSMRMFLEHRDELRATWTYSHEIVWAKNAGSGFAADRFKRVHEFAVHYYHGPWAAIYKQVPRVAYNGPNNGRRRKGVTRGTHTGRIREAGYTDDGTRLANTVICAPRPVGIGPCAKATEVLSQLIFYACPPGGLVVDPFAGSGSTGVAARQLSRRAVLIEAREDYCDAIARRLAQGVLDLHAHQQNVN